MSKKEKAQKIAKMMKEHNDRYGFPTKPKQTKDSDIKKK